MLQGPKRGHFSRSRSLADFNRKFNGPVVQETLEAAFSVGEEVRALEIGCGEGRVLMEILKLFPDSELHGINKKPWPAMKGSQSLPRTAAHYHIFTPAQLRGLRLPQMHFYDASHLDFPDNYFDLVISQVAVQYVARKDLLLQEVWRTLKHGASAYIHIDSRQENYPDFLQMPCPRFVIYDGKKVCTIRQLAGSCRQKGFNIRYNETNETEKGVNKQRMCLVMHKTRMSPLELGLVFDEVSSFDLKALQRDDKRDDIFWGYRSVYNLK
jgi:SAM-dependent methyltransferase